MGAVECAGGSDWLGGAPVSRKYINISVTFLILVQNGLFSLFFTVFDLSRPLEVRLSH